MNQYGTQVLSPNFSEQAFVKRLRPAEKFIFQITYSKLLKTFFDTGSNHGGGPSVPL